MWSIKIRCSASPHLTDFLCGLFKRKDHTAQGNIKARSEEKVIIYLLLSLSNVSKPSEVLYVLGEGGVLWDTGYYGTNSKSAP